MTDLMKPVTAVVERLDCPVLLAARERIEVRIEDCLHIRRDESQKGQSAAVRHDTTDLSSHRC